MNRSLLTFQHRAKFMSVFRGGVMSHLIAKIRRLKEFDTALLSASVEITLKCLTLPFNRIHFTCPA